MLVAARSDEHENRLRPFPGARPPRRGQWTAGARRSPIAFVTAVKVPNDRMRGSQFSSWNISLPYRRYGCASFLCIALADPTPDKTVPECGPMPKKGHLWGGTYSSPGGQQSTDSLVGLGFGLSLTDVHPICLQSSVLRKIHFRNPSSWRRARRIQSPNTLCLY